jgi:hypothetical protein
MRNINLLYFFNIALVLQVGGYTELYEGGLTLATVRDAGHQVPSYQPTRALSLIKHFLDGTPLPGTKRIWLSLGFLSAKLVSFVWFQLPWFIKKVASCYFRAKLNWLLFSFSFFPTFLIGQRFFTWTEFSFKMGRMKFLQPSL